MMNLGKKIKAKLKWFMCSRETFFWAWLQNRRKHELSKEGRKSGRAPAKFCEDFPLKIVNEQNSLRKDLFVNEQK